MRQRASLDFIADNRPTPPGQEEDFEDQDQDPRVVIQDDSQSTSSSSSPPPADIDESDFFLNMNDSQSSLGVPNLQDMQVIDVDCLPPVNRLPNELLMSVFAKLSSPVDLLHVMLTCKRWSRNAVEILWHRPACSSWGRHALICQTLGIENPYFSYRDFIRRLNLSSLSDRVNDGSVTPLAVCTRLERLTLTACRGLTDSGLIALVQGQTHLLALDILANEQITEASIIELAETCKRLQGLNISGCIRISNDSLIKVAKNCKYLKRVKLNDCLQLNDEAVVAFAEHCLHILEIDLHHCRHIGNEPITALLANGLSLREFRLGNCELIDDGAFLCLPRDRTYENLRILDLTSCARLTDRAIERIVEVAPRLRNIVLAKCRNLTDATAYALSRLGKNLHYLHLGHVGHLTDEAVKRLVQSCNRIRYIDLGCCVHLTDESITKLAHLPKLKRVGLVKCGGITDKSVIALARANQRLRPRRDTHGHIIDGQYYASHSSLERVHLSYCTNLTLDGILRLLNACPNLTHLSLTGVQAFLRNDLATFCRDAPPEFTDHQRRVFCVFSGQGVRRFRDYLNHHHEDIQTDRNEGLNALPPPAPVHFHAQWHYNQPVWHAAAHVPGLLQNPAALDDGEGAEADVLDEDEEYSEMILDAQPLDNAVTGGAHTFAAGPLPPPVSQINLFPHVVGRPPYVSQLVHFDEYPPTLAPVLSQPGADMDANALAVMVHGQFHASSHPTNTTLLSSLGPSSTSANGEASHAGPSRLARAEDQASYAFPRIREGSSSDP